MRQSVNSTHLGVVTSPLALTALTLVLSGPEKSTPTNQEELEEEVLIQLLDEELEEQKAACGPPRLVQPLSIRLTPLRKAPPNRDTPPLNSSLPGRSVTPPPPPAPPLGFSISSVL